VNIYTQRGQESGYATLNPLANGGTLSKGNLKFTSGSAYRSSVSTIGMSSGKWYMEGLAGTFGNDFTLGLVSYTDINSVKSNYVGGTSASYGYEAALGAKYNNSSYTTTNFNTYTTGDLISVAFDADNGKVYFAKNGIWQDNANPVAGTNASYSSLTSTPYFFGCSAGINGVWEDINFGQKPFKFPPPAGFQPLALANTRPTIVRPDQFVGIVTYTGNGGTQSINVGFKPDFVWIKNRDAGDHSGLFDSIRGPLYRIVSDYTYASTLRVNTLTSFNTNGFTVGSAGEYNRLNERIVAWAWKAGGNSNTYNINDIGYSTASAAGLTAGTITPTAASINTKSGFSIITWNGSGASGTLSHGLGNTPGLIFLKGTSSGEGSENWRTYHSALGTSPSNTLFLNLTNASSSNTERISAVGTSTFTLSSGGAGVNASGQSYIAYLWAEIPGFSKFGSYSGTGVAENFVYTGFRPKWIMIKNYIGGSISNWALVDSTRSFANVANHTLAANLANAESAFGGGESVFGAGNKIDLVSNGFVLREGNAWGNETSTSYIYAAYAESPTQNLFGGQSNAR